MVTLIASSYQCSSMRWAHARQFPENTVGFLSTTAQKKNYGEHRNGDAHGPEKNVADCASFLLSPEELHWSFHVLPPCRHRRT